MDSLSSLLTIVHFIGLSLAVGAATVKVVLLLRCKSNNAMVPVYLNVVRPITKVLITGMILLTLSGIVWLLDGYPLMTILIIKLVFVAAIWILGPIIDNVVEPKFKQLAPTVDQPASPEFGQIMNKYLALEITATSLFYLIIIYWILA